MSKRAFGITNSEISAMIWIIGFLMSCIALKVTYDTFAPAMGNPAISNAFMIVLMMFFMNTIFSFASMSLPNYLISKYNLNILVDRIKNPDFIGWIRFTRNKRLCFHVVKNGPLGQTKGTANGEKADAINDGSYTITTPSGNQAILKSDLLSHNINLERAVGWQLINKHFGLVGFRAWEKAEDDGKLVYKRRIKIRSSKTPKKDKEVWHG